MVVEAHMFHLHNPFTFGGCGLVFVMKLFHWSVLHPSLRTVPLVSKDLGGTLHCHGNLQVAMVTEDCMCWGLCHWRFWKLCPFLLNSYWLNKQVWCCYHIKIGKYHGMYYAFLVMMRFLFSKWCSCHFLWKMWFYVSGKPKQHFTFSSFNKQVPGLHSLSCFCKLKSFHCTPNVLTLLICKAAFYSIWIGINNHLWVNYFLLFVDWVVNQIFICKQWMIRLIWNHDQKFFDSLKLMIPYIHIWTSLGVTMHFHGIFMFKNPYQRNRWFLDDHLTLAQIFKVICQKPNIVEMDDHIHIDQKANGICGLYRGSR